MRRVKPRSWLVCRSMVSEYLPTKVSTVCCCSTRTACETQLSDSRASTALAPAPMRLDFAGDELLENDPEHVVLTQQLVHRRALFIAQRPQFGGLGHHRRVGGNRLVAGRAQELRNLGDQLRNVIEQLGGRKHLALVDRQDLREGLEPF